MKILRTFLYLVARLFIPLRYRLCIKGLDKIDPNNLPKKGGIVFLSNHPAEIDPCILVVILWRRFKPHSLAIEYLFHKPFFRYFLEMTGALPVPNFDQASNSFKLKQINSTYRKLGHLLKNKEHLLIYPAGGLKRQAEEKIGGTSGVQKVLNDNPEANVVLIRATGLWGSSFSKALTGKTPDLKAAFIHGIKVLLKNLIFFTPRRIVTIEFELAENFPVKASRKEINQTLEDWYNKNGPEPLKLVSYAFWKNEIPTLPEMASNKTGLKGEIPSDVEKIVREELSQMTSIPAQSIEMHQDLAKDLGLDSLDQAQLVLMLKEKFGIQKVQPADLVTVESVMGYAAGLIESERTEDEFSGPPPKWESVEDRPLPFGPQGRTIHEAFLNSCHKMEDFFACADMVSGEMSYKRIRLGVLILAKSIAKLPGKRIGVLLPASVGAMVTVLACLFARKIPVMINWTLGPRNLKSILEQAKTIKTISSWNFLDRLENVDLNGVDEQLVLLENVRRSITWSQKAKAIWLSKKSTSKILKKYKLSRISENQPAVLLFTSGTESFPKGVPLSHKNLLSNQQDAFDSVFFQKGDVLLGALPPFHSFGFSVTGIFPLLSGLRIVYSPNPTDGRKLALSIERWKVTLLVLAPTFFKNILRTATAEQLQTLRTVVLGAEKAPDEIRERTSQLLPQAELIEGYGITECSPILTVNRMGEKHGGVGRALPHVELKIVNPETLQQTQDEGLILVRGPNVFAGYLDKNLRSPFITFEGQEWYNTGDIGFLKEGHLYLSGRLKRFIKIGGEMVSLNAIEEILYQGGVNLGWPIVPDTPSLAISAIEGDKKTQIHLFSTFPVPKEAVNTLLKEKGMSNLIRVSSVIQVRYIPLLGTGKVDYRSLETQLKEPAAAQN